MTQNSQQSPFNYAMSLAREITRRDDDTTELQKAVMALDDQGQKSLVFQVANECLRPSMKMEVPAVFGVAYPAHMMPVAHTTKAIRDAMEAGELNLADLVRIGLLEIKGERFVAHLGHEAVREAAVALHERGNTDAATVLERHLAYGEERKLLAEARRETKKAAEAKAEKVETEAKAAEAEQSTSASKAATKRVRKKGATPKRTTKTASVKE